MNYQLKGFSDKKFTDKQDLARFIKSDLDNFLRLKMSMIKDNTNKCFDTIIAPDSVDKLFKPEIDKITSDKIEVEAVINTTNIIDSHIDLHMPTVWDKTVKENPTTYHLQEHEARFKAVVDSKAKQYNIETNFSKLGLRKDWRTVANINKFVFDRAKNDLMYNAYINGEVKEHSVGMYYVKIDFAYYDEESQKNMDFFEKAKSYAINPNVADENGYVWVVYEAKKREGSSVVFGSNPITPTLSVKNYEPQTSTRLKEAAISTSAINYEYLTQKIKELK